MADLTGKYVIHASGGLTAAQIAALYGLSGGEYITGPVALHTWDRYIHLYAREDGRYESIKQNLGDYDETPYNDKMPPRALQRLKERSGGEVW